MSLRAVEKPDKTVEFSLHLFTAVVVIGSRSRLNRNCIRRRNWNRNRKFPVAHIGIIPAILLIKTVDKYVVTFGERVRIALICAHLFIVTFLVGDAFFPCTADNYISNR